MEKHQIIDDRYEVISVLGSGGFSEVLEVIDHNSGENFAIKRLLKTNRRSPFASKLLLREGSILTKVRHPNIVKAYRQGDMSPASEELVSPTLATPNSPTLNSARQLDNDQSPYLVLELLRGIQLDQWIAQHYSTTGKQPSTELILTILQQLSRALGAIHSAGYLHHDVTPRNVMLIRGENGICRVVLFDLGVALALGEQDPQERDLGTLHYRSPEHALARQLDVKSDIYAFGVLAFELLTGKKPFDVSPALKELGELAYAQAIGSMHALREPPRIRTAERKYQPIVQRMIHICMEKDPVDRYQSMHEIEERITDLL